MLIVTVPDEQYNLYTVKDIVPLSHKSLCPSLFLAKNEEDPDPSLSA
jgi:hypothetical protein